MQAKFVDGSVMIAGNVTRDAEIFYVGEKSTPLLKFGVAVGKNKDTTTIFVNCIAWRKLAQGLNGLKKGDSFCGIGRINTKEYNGKEYKDLELEWGNSPMLNTGATFAPPPTEGDIPDINKDFKEYAEDELPF